MDPQSHQEQAKQNSKASFENHACSNLPSGWAHLPSVVLSAVIRHLSLEDRKICTMVCRRWNDVVFSASLNRNVTFPLAKWNYDRACYVLFSGFLPSVQRSYRSAEVSWINYPDVQYLFAINELFEVLPKYSLKRLFLNATPDETIGEFFERHRSVLNDIQELHVYIGSPYNQYPLPADDAPLETRQCSLNMRALECLEWIEASLGNIAHGRQYFMIDTPMLRYTKIQGLQNWNCYTVLNIRNCPKLKNIMLELPNRIWRTFQNHSFEQLNTLNITTLSSAIVIERIPAVQFDQLFSSMKNLQAIKIAGAKDDALLAVCRHCPLIWSIELSRFKVNFDSFVKLAGLQRLQNLDLDTGEIIGCKGGILCESLKTLRIHEVALVNGEYKRFPLKLKDAMKRKLRYSKHKEDIICNYSTR